MNVVKLFPDHPPVPKAQVTDQMMRRAHLMLEVAGAATPNKKRQIRGAARRPRGTP